MYEFDNRMMLMNVFFVRQERPTVPTAILCSKIALQQTDAYTNLTNLNHSKLNTNISYNDIQPKRITTTSNIERTSPTSDFEKKPSTDCIVKLDSTCIYTYDFVLTGISVY